jgi:outer membrane lipase/esterase
VLLRSAAEYIISARKTNPSPGEFRMSIRSLSCVVTLALLLAFQPIAANASAPAYSAIYVFGDSYCDVGNVFIATGGTQPSAPYFNGRFSDGPIWVDHIASARSLPMLPALAGGTDYAFGGAHVTGPVPTPFGNLPSVPQQVLLYLSQHGGKADPNALYIIEGGGNDIVDAAGVGSPQQLGFQIALGISSAELILRRAGAKNFLIPNLFDISILPVAKSNAAFARQATLSANKSLDDLLFLEQLFQGLRIRRIDAFSLFTSVSADATHFGFTDITNPCFNGVNPPCADPAHKLFWDGFHPTVFGHSFFAVLVEAALSQ